MYHYWCISILKQIKCNQISKLFIFYIEIYNFLNIFWILLNYIDAYKYIGIKDSK